jgi:hypothetical protein
MSIVIVCAILLFVLFYNKTLDGKKFLADNEKYFEILREEDYNFLLFAKYGDDLDCDELYKKRISTALIVGFIFLAITIADFSFVNLIIVIVIMFGIFKLPYIQLKSFYKKHLHEIDLLLPYYLKSLEILIQHYTVPVAIGKSIADAPEIFRPGLKKIVERINTGDSSIDPYMEFANDYPVRDSMRMMRLLYRLGIGSQEMKHERLMMFSKSVSSLQNKAREVKYKERLDHMENQTMIMLVVTGFGVMLIILVSMLMMFNM